MTLQRLSQVKNKNGGVMDPLNREAIGLRIKRERTKKKIKQCQLATEASVSTTHVSLIEKGSPLLSMKCLIRFLKR